MTASRRSFPVDFLSTCPGLRTTFQTQRAGDLSWSTKTPCMGSVVIRVSRTRLVKVPVANHLAVCKFGVMNFGNVCLCVQSVGGLQGTTPTWQACQAACFASPGTCTAWTWNGPGISAPFTDVCCWRTDGQFPVGRWVCSRAYTYLTWGHMHHSAPPRIASSLRRTVHGARHSPRQ